MRLAIDGRELFNPYGMGRLLSQTITNLRRFSPEIEITLFIHRDKSRLLNVFGDLTEDRSLRIHSCPISLSHLIWENYFLAPNLTPENFDLFYLPHNHSGLIKLNIPLVALICDLIPQLFPRYYTDAGETIARTANAARLSDRIVTLSNCSKRDIHQLLRVPEAKIEINHPGISDIFTPDKDNDLNLHVLSKFKITKPYFLNVGGFDPRKNLSFLLKTFAKYISRTNDDIKLVVVGPLKAINIFKNFENPLSLIKKLRIESRVIFTDTVSDEELKSLYQEAVSLVFPSLYEGFGLPPAEALACGTPVNAASGSSIEEAVNEAALFFPANDEEALIAGLIKVRHHKTSFSRQRQSGLAWAKTLTWRNWTSRLYRIFEETIN